MVVSLKLYRANREDLLTDVVTLSGIQEITGEKTFLNDATISGNLNIYGNLDFGADSTYNLGSSSNKIGTVWSSAFKSNSSVAFESTGGDVYVASPASHYIYLRTNGANKWVINDSGALYANTDNTYSLGLSNRYIHTAYIYRLNMGRYFQFWNDNIRGVEEGGSPDLFLTSYNTSGPIVFHVSNTTGSYGSRIAVQGTNLNVPFTGTHRFMLHNDYTDPECGDAVCLLEGKVIKCNTSYSKTCIGLLTDEISISGMGNSTHQGYGEGIIDSYGNLVSGQNLYHIASVGDCRVEGSLEGFKVCDEGGNIEAGDFLTTASGYPGYLKKQDDDLVHNYTIGKSMEDVDFEDSPTASGIYGFIYCG